jgi:hypothetical protein
MLRLPQFKIFKEYLVKVKFSSEITPYIQEKKWHKQQTLIMYQDGGCQLDVTLDNLNEIIRWILGWGHMRQLLNHVSCKIGFTTLPVK